MRSDLRIGNTMSKKPYNEILNPLIELIQTQLNVQLSSSIASPPANGNKK